MGFNRYLYRRLLSESGDDAATFWRHIESDPHDRTAMLVFADWLDEHGQGELAGCLRRIGEHFDDPKAMYAGMESAEERLGFWERVFGLDHRIGLWWVPLSPQARRPHALRYGWSHHFEHVPSPTDLWLTVLPIFTLPHEAVVEMHTAAIRRPLGTDEREHVMESLVENKDMDGDGGAVATWLKNYSFPQL